MKASAKEMLRKELQRLYAQHDLSTFVTDAVAQLSNNEQFLGANEILAYNPMPDEVPFIVDLQAKFDTKRWFFPSKTTVGFVSATTGELWAPNILEKVILIAPARAANSNGARIGRGGGWYDRFLAKHHTIYSLVVIPKFAHKENIPREEHDVAVNKVLVIDA